MTTLSSNSISVILPALNEAACLADTVRLVHEVAGIHFADHEVIIVNDGSTDGTDAVSEALAQNDARVRVIHHARPHGLGGAYKAGLALAQGHYVTRVNGKTDTSVEALGGVWALKGQADMIIPYQLNAHERVWYRLVVSNIFTRMMNILFGLNLRYYNHYTLHKRVLLESIRIRTNSYACDAEILVKLIKRGHDYLEVGHQDNYENDQVTKIFRPRNFWGVATFFVQTLWDVYGGVNGRPVGPSGNACE